MSEVSTAELRRHVERRHECRVELRELVAVREEFEGSVAWEGIVHVFVLYGHLDAAESCYAWSSPVEDSETRRFYAVLHTAEIDSPAKAVRAAIVSDHRAQD